MPTPGPSEVHAIEQDSRAVHQPAVRTRNTMSTIGHSPNHLGAPRRLLFFSPKNGVKPPGHVTHCQPTTYTCLMSSPATSIMDIEIKKEKPQSASPPSY